MFLGCIAYLGITLKWKAALLHLRCFSTIQMLVAIHWAISYLHLLFCVCKYTIFGTVWKATNIELWQFSSAYHVLRPLVSDHWSATSFLVNATMRYQIQLIICCRSCYRLYYCLWSLVLAYTYTKWLIKRELWEKENGKSKVYAPDISKCDCIQ